ncbi:hypothetical protein [Spiroplasma citri]|nr:hypothetical protein [Spiroplasma citri]QIA68068.1 hypothetical protein GMI18_10980 [Spiroplasma citri]
MKCQRINCNNKNAYCGNSYIEKSNDKLEWNLGYKNKLYYVKNTDYKLIN